MLKESYLPLTMNLDIIQTLNELPENESEKLEELKSRITEYCNNEKATYHIFRVLKEIELDLHDCLNGLIHINVDREVIVKVLRTIRIKSDIIKINMKYQDFFEVSEPKPAGRWTDDKLNLIELIYAISKTRSMNNGKITLKKIQEYFEFLFQVKLGNITNQISEIDNRNGQDELYLGILITNLNTFFDKINL